MQLKLHTAAPVVLNQIMKPGQEGRTGKPTCPHFLGLFVFSEGFWFWKTDANERITAKKRIQRRHLKQKSKRVP